MYNKIKHKPPCDIYYSYLRKDYLYFGHMCKYIIYLVYTEIILWLTEYTHKGQFGRLTYSPRTVHGDFVLFKI